MSSPQYSILFSAPVSGTGPSSGSVGDVLLPDSATGLYVKATTANRGTRRSTGMALSPYTAGGVVDVQQFGQVDSTTAGLGAGTASWVRVSTTGVLERASVSGSDDVVGYVDTDGTFHACFGFLTATLVNGGGSGFTAPTGTGFASTTAGALDVASRKVDLASSTYTTGTLPVARGGTNRSALGSSLQVLRTNVGVTDTEWATLSSGSASSGGAGQVQTSDGAGGFSAPADVLAGADFVSIGTTPATTGSLRFAKASSYYFRDSGNTSDMVAVFSDGTDQLFIGSNASFGERAFYTYLRSAIGTYIGVGSTDVLAFASTATKSTNPVIGYASPYGAHGGVIYAFAADASYTLSAAEYVYQRIKFNAGSWTAGRTVTFPAPGFTYDGYGKSIWNNTGFTMTISTGTGTTKTLATGLGQHFWFDDTGVRFDSATFTP